MKALTNLCTRADWTEPSPTEGATSFLNMEQMDSITEHFGIKRYRSVAAVCAIYPDAQTVETHLYLKLT